MKYLSQLAMDPYLWALALLSASVTGSILYIVLASVTY